MNNVQTHLKDQRPARRAVRRGVLALLALALLVGGGLAAWRLAPAALAARGQATAEAQSAYKTTTVRRSDLSPAISGSGTVITARSEELGFLVGGTLAELTVQPGDSVTQGQELARLGDTAALRQAILDQELAVKVAQRDLDNLLSGGGAALAKAQADQAAAAQADAEAQASTHSAGDARCSVSTTQQYYFAYLYAQKDVDAWQAHLNNPNTGYGRDYILENLRPLRQKRDQAYSNYTYCQGYTAQEIASSQAAAQLAKAQLDQASARYAQLKASAGVDPAQVAQAEAVLENARRQLASARAQLAGTVITAPMAGTVTAVNAKLGDEVETGTLITLADLTQPQVQVYMDEADLTSFAVGCSASVTFDSISGETFPGTVTSVSPALVTVNSASMVEGLVELEKKQTASGKSLSVGMTAAVEVVCSEAKDALIVPAQALYTAADGSQYVYVLDSQGQPEQRGVVTGLRTVASAQVTAGLSEGETIITSPVEP